MANAMSNKSGLRPLGHAVLVELYEPERKGALIVMPDNVKQRTALVEQRAVVVEVGPDAWKGYPPRAAPGDKVLVSKFAGYVAQGTADGKIYRIVNDNDLFCQITSEEFAEQERAA